MYVVIMTTDVCTYMYVHMYVYCDVLSVLLVPRGHRGWKAYYAYLKGFMLYFTEVRGGGGWGGCNWWVG